MTEPVADQVDDLPSEAILERTTHGWSIRLPVRSEAIHVRKQVVVSERVVVHRVVRSDVDRIDTTVRRERLRVDTPEYDALAAPARAELERDSDAPLAAEPLDTHPESPTRGRRQARRTTRRR